MLNQHKPNIVKIKHVAQFWPVSFNFIVSVFHLTFTLLHLYSFQHSNSTFAYFSAFLFVNSIRSFIYWCVLSLLGFGIWSMMYFKAIEWNRIFYYQFIASRKLSFNYPCSFTCFCNYFLLIYLTLLFIHNCHI